MRKANIRLWIVLAVAVLIWASGCSSSDGGGSGTTKLTIGQTTTDEIKADGTNSYEFTTNDSGAYSINYDTVSTGDAQTLDINTSLTIVCVFNPTSAECAIQENLTAATKYTFDLVELSGQDTTFRIYVYKP